MIENERLKLNFLRDKTLIQLEDALEVPMIVLAFVWLGLTIVELTQGLSPILTHATTVIWILFWVDFLLKFFIATHKLTFLKHNIITVLALLVPAIRVFRVIRVLRFTRLFRGTYLIKILGTFNRGMGALSKTLGRRGFGYILFLTIIVVFLGAAGIYSFEKEDGGFIDDYGTALWWSAMMITTMGSDFFPKSSEGRVLSFVLAIYGFAIFGYVTATVASFFVDRDAASPNASLANDKKLNQIEKELKELKALIADRK
jgi:voltage-gated potassium channel